MNGKPKQIYCQNKIQVTSKSNEATRDTISNNWQTVVAAAVAMLLVPHSFLSHLHCYSVHVCWFLLRYGSANGVLFVEHVMCEFSWILLLKCLSHTTPAHTICHPIHTYTLCMFHHRIWQIGCILMKFSIFPFCLYFFSCWDAVRCFTFYICSTFKMIEIVGNEWAIVCGNRLILRSFYM